MTFSTENIAAIIVCGLLALAIPIAAVIIYKIKNKDAWLPSAFIGIGTDLVIEAVAVVPMVVLRIFLKDNTALHIILSLLIVGIIEGTGWFVLYKTVMKNHCSTKNAVMAGLGYGGLKMAALALTMLTYLIRIFYVGDMGIDAYLEKIAGYSPEQMETLRTQIEALKDVGFVNILSAIFGRLFPMTFYVCLSVWTYKAVSRKGKLWLCFVAALLTYSAFEIPSVINQFFGLVPSYIAAAVLMAVAVIITVKSAKKFPDRSDQTTLNWR